MNRVDCYCSICGNKMQTTGFSPNKNYCSRECLQIANEEKQAIKDEEYWAQALEQQRRYD